MAVVELVWNNSCGEREEGAYSRKQRRAGPEVLLVPTLTPHERGPPLARHITCFHHAATLAPCQSILKAMRAFGGQATLFVVAVAMLAVGARSVSSVHFVPQ